MSETLNSDLAIVLPAYRPPIDRLVEYINALDARLAPARIHVPLNGVRESDPQIARVERTGATVTPTVGRQGKATALSRAFD
jgi:hypothetical protein